MEESKNRPFDWVGNVFPLWNLALFLLKPKCVRRIEEREKEKKDLAIPFGWVHGCRLHSLGRSSRSDERRTLHQNRADPTHSRLYDALCAFGPLAPHTSIGLHFVQRKKIIAFNTTNTFSFFTVSVNLLVVVEKKSERIFQILSMFGSGNSVVWESTIVHNSKIT